MPKELSDTLAGIGRAMQGIYNGIEGLTERIESMGTSSGSSEGNPDDDKGGFQGDLESLDRKDFMGVIVGEMVRKLDQRLDQRFEKFQEENVKPLAMDADENQKEKVLKMIQAAKETHKDFDQWYGEMKQVADAMPGITPEDAYHLARKRNPEKATEIDKKLESQTEEEKKAEEQRRREEEVQNKKKEAKETSESGIFALTPTSGAKATEDSENLDQNTAADTAWERVFGGE